MSEDAWIQTFRDVHARGLAALAARRHSPSTLFPPGDVEFLASIGCSPQELFDFIEDLQDYGEPDLETALAVQAIRRDYFLNVQGGKPSDQKVPMSELPPKSEAVDGISWLPRLIVKARLKLRGEMPDDLMYGCGGDRPFLRRMRSSLPEFLTLVRECGDDDRRIIDTLKRGAGL
jgi:hypothetical protein